MQQILSQTKQQKRVRFAEEVEVREYPIILGVNPSVLKGPPLSLDWKWVSSDIVLIPTPDSSGYRSKARKRTGIERCDLLRQLGYTQSEISRGTKRTNVSRNRRRATRCETEFVSSAREGIETMRRAFGNALSFGALNRKERAYLQQCGVY